MPLTGKITSYASRSTQHAFTLVEIMVVVTLIALLAAIGIPYVVKAKQASRANIMANDLRTISQWFINYTQETAIYPPDSATREIPAGMEEYVTAKWLEPTPIGGYYNYEYNKTAQGTQYKMGIGIRDSGTNLVTTDAGMLRAVDELIDDGNLTTGSFLLGPGNAPFYVIER